MLVIALDCTPYNKYDTFNIHCTYIDIHVSGYVSPWGCRTM